MVSATAMATERGVTEERGLLKQEILAMDMAYMTRERLSIPRCYRKLRIEGNMALNIEISRGGFHVNFPVCYF